MVKTNFLWLLELELTAACLKTEILTEKWHHMILKAVGHSTSVSAGIQFEAVRDPVLIERLVQLDGIDSQAILVSNIDSDRAILAQVPDVLVQKSER